MTGDNKITGVFKEVEITELNFQTTHLNPRQSTTSELRRTRYKTETKNVLQNLVLVLYQFYWIECCPSHLTERSHEGVPHEIELRTMLCYSY